MRRTTKALARLATLAVVAGGALSAPFAIGTANATVSAVTVVNGTIGSNEDAAAQAQYPNIATVTWTAGATGSTISLAGTSAYFPATAQQPAGLTVNSPTTATCTGGTTCTARVGDPAAESVTAFIVDPSDASSASPTVGFNGIFITGCPGTGIETGAPYTNPIPAVNGVLYGTPAQRTNENCVTQGQFGQPLTLSAKYLAGGAGVIQGTSVFLFGNEQAGANTASCTEFSVTRIDCTSDSSGNFTFNVIDNGTTPPSPPNPETSSIEITTRNTTGTYPQILDSPDAHLGGAPGAAPTEQVNWGNGGVTPTRVDGTAVTLLAPSTQAGGSAEPGDVIQGTFKVMGSCTPVSPNVTCDNGTPLAGVPVTVTVDHGFITPNCTKGGITSYAQCSFNPTPTVGAQVGNLTNSGQSATFSTGVNGTFNASFGIARDSAFDAAGLVITTITVGGLPVDVPGDHDNTHLCPTGGEYGLPLVGGGATLVALPTPGSTFRTGCPVGMGWTTDEQPLNGGTAKLVGVPSLSQPNNVLIPTENNTLPSDSGTVNVPDPNRVVFKVSLTDQFGNLTSNKGAAAPNAATLTKTGPGQLWFCGAAFTSTDPCSTPTVTNRNSDAQQADGTFTEIYKALGSFTNANAQNRYQVDTGPNGPAAGANTGYGTVQISVNDGTTTVVLSWTPPTTTFATFHAGTPTIATFQSGNGAAQTDTYTLNFYNQLAQPVVTFSAKPGNTVGTSTPVTVAATLVDNFGNPIVVYCPGGVAGCGDPVQIQVLRTGGNESSCVPAQNGFNGAPNLIQTNTSGVAGFTFSCNAPGLSTVSMVVQGPGGVQLASGHEAITFTGPPPAGTITEKPTVSLASHSRHHLTVTVHTHPALRHVKVNIYKVVNGLPHLIGALGTNRSGTGHVTLSGLRSGHVYHIRVLVVNLGARYHSVFSRTAKARVL